MDENKEKAITVLKGIIAAIENRDAHIRAWNVKTDVDIKSISFDGRIEFYIHEQL